MSYLSGIGRNRLPIPFTPRLPASASKKGSPVWFRLCRVREPWLRAR